MIGLIRRLRSTEPRAEAPSPARELSLEEQLTAVCAQRDRQQEKVERQSRMIERLRDQERRYA